MKSILQTEKRQDQKWWIKSLKKIYLFIDFVWCQANIKDHQILETMQSFILLYLEELTVIILKEEHLTSGSTLKIKIEYKNN